jgi:hypothetical protein
MPEVVPLAKPPRPSASSHSAESDTRDMARLLLRLWFVNRYLNGYWFLSLGI